MLFRQRWWEVVKVAVASGGSSISGSSNTGGSSAAHSLDCEFQVAIEMTGSDAGTGAPTGHRSAATTTLLLGSVGLTLLGDNVLPVPAKTNSSRTAANPQLQLVLLGQNANCMEVAVHDRSWIAPLPIAAHFPNGRSSSRNLGGAVFHFLLDDMTADR